MAEEKENSQTEPETVQDKTVAGQVSVDTESPEKEADLERLQAEVDETRERYLRAAAELENLQRRTEQDVANAHKYAIEKFAHEVLTVRDSLELARNVEMDIEDQASEEAVSVLGKMHEGLDLTLKQLDGVLEKFNMELLDPVGQRFNPEQHQAMSMVESGDVEPNHVLAVVQKGCLLNGRLLRPAMVMVAKAENKENAAE